MPYENDETRRAARERLQQRLDRRASAGATRRSAPSTLRSSRTRPDSRTRYGSTRLSSAFPGDIVDTFERVSSVSPTARVAIVAIVLGLVVLLVFASRCESPAQVGEQTAESGRTAAAMQVNSDPGTALPQSGDRSVEPDENDSRQRPLVDLVGEVEAGKLLSAAKTNPEALWIAAHADRYAFDGPEVQRKLLKLAADEPAAITFVREFPSQYPSSEPKNDGTIALSARSPSPDVPDTRIPHLYQWDRRWGDTVYSSAAFGLTGCGPTSLAMVYQGVTGATDKSPYDFAVLSEERNYMAEYGLSFKKCVQFEVVAAGQAS